MILKQSKGIAVNNESITLRHILVDYQFEAEDLARKIKSGADFQELAKKFSKCSSRKQGGDLGQVARRRLDETFADAAFALRQNQISEPVRTRFGYHLIQRY